jgi:maltooligosyltrehalose synthase
VGAGFEPQTKKPGPLSRPGFPFDDGVAVTYFRVRDAHYHRRKLVSRCRAEENIIAFSLSSGNEAVVAVAPRPFSRLMDGDDLAPLGAKAWGKARLPLEGQYVNALTGERHGGAQPRLAEVLASFPVALLVHQ